MGWLALRLLASARIEHFRPWALKYIADHPHYEIEGDQSAAIHIYIAMPDGTRQAIHCGGLQFDLFCVFVCQRLRFLCKVGVVST